MQYWTSRAYLVLMWVFLAGVFVQFFFAGVFVFHAQNNFDLHKNFAGFLELSALVLVILSLLWRPGWDTVGFTVLLLVLCVIQHPLAEAIKDHRWVAALHPVNALLIAGLAYMLAQRARTLSAATAKPAAA